jgi:hypothetical protein
MRCSLLAVSAVIVGVESRRTRVTWVNGIAHNLDHMEEGRRVMSKFFAGKPILFCYNPTAMGHDDDMRGYLTDLTQAGQQKLGVVTTEVQRLVRHLKDSVAAVGKHGCVVHIAHSQGALITSLASQQLSPSEMEQIEVLAFGGAAVLRRTPQTPFKRCINYYSVNDPLLMVVPSAAQALRSGLLVGDGEDEFCFLAPRVGDPILDHNLWGPTYGQALKWEGDRFQRLYVSPFYRLHHLLVGLITAIVRVVIHRLLTILWKLRTAIATACLNTCRGVVRAYVAARDLFLERLVEPVVQLVMLLLRSGSRDKYETVSLQKQG